MLLNYRPDTPAGNSTDHRRQQSTSEGTVNASTPLSAAGSIFAQTVFLLFVLVDREPPKLGTNEEFYLCTWRPEKN